MGVARGIPALEIAEFSLHALEGEFEIKASSAALFQIKTFENALAKCNGVSPNIDF